MTANRVKQDEQNRQALPEFTLTNVLGDVKNVAHGLIFDPDYNVIVFPGIFLAESLLVKVIRARVPYTDIDYTAYIDQIEIINSGELDYENIYGVTGPLVYPAGFVKIYQAMNWITNGTQDIAMGQLVFSWLYLLNLFLVLVIYFNLGVKPWVGVLLMLSKRLHSIYILRLFNDAFTTLFMVLMVLALQYAGLYKKSMRSLSKVLTNFIAPTFFSLALSIKMNALLYTPGFLLILYFLNDEILLSLMIPLAVVLFWQLFIGASFLFNGATIRESYISNAFDFGRQFMYKWTVNFRFVPEETFNSTCFHKTLLIIHIFLLLFFLFTKWVTPRVISKSIPQFINDAVHISTETLETGNIILDRACGPRYIVGVLASCNLIGIICARSLHYQFLSWYAWTYPYLIGSANTNIVIGVALWTIHEWCWNVYPSTVVSSLALVTCNLIVLGIYWFSSCTPQPSTPSDGLQEHSDNEKKTK